MTTQGRIIRFAVLAASATITVLVGWWLITLAASLLKMM